MPIYELRIFVDSHIICRFVSYCMKKARKKIKKIRRKKTKKLIRKKVKKAVKKAAKKRRKKPRKRQMKKRPIKRRVRKVKKARKRHKTRIRKRRPAKKVKKTKRAKRVKRAKMSRKYSKGMSLEQLFESPAKVQVMKLFFRNPETNFLLKEAARSMRMNLSMARKQMKKLAKIGFLKTRQISFRKQAFYINPNFDFFNELKELILKSSPVPREKILKAVRGLGRIRLVLLSGLLVGNPVTAGSRADLLIVGDSINSRKLNTFIKNLEAEAGTDIRCVAMTTEEFNYRYDMYDRFVRDLLSEEGEFLINKLGL